MNPDLANALKRALTISNSLFALVTLREPLSTLNRQITAEQLQRDAEAIAAYARNLAKGEHE